MLVCVSQKLPQFCPFCLCPYFQPHYHFLRSLHFHGTFLSFPCHSSPDHQMPLDFPTFPSHLISTSNCSTVTHSLSASTPTPHFPNHSVVYLPTYHCPLPDHQCCCVPLRSSHPIICSCLFPKIRSSFFSGGGGTK